MVRNLEDRILRPGWELVSLGKICTVGTGGTPSTKIDEYYADEVNWLKSGDIKTGTIESFPHKISQLGLENSSAKVYPKDTVMIAMSGQGKTRGICGITSEETACSQSVAAIICGPRISPFYLQKYLTSMYKRIRDWTGDNSRSGLNLTIIRSFQVLLPPLREQEAIHQILESASKSISYTEISERIRNELVESVFVEMFGDPVGESNWEKVPFLDAVKDVTKGKSKIAQSEYLDEGNTPIIDQGRKFIGGWTNNETIVSKVDSPVIIFGDHTTILKYIDFDFVLGADGVKVLVPISDDYSPFFLYHLLRFFPMPDVGYSRHFKFMKEWRLIKPPRFLQDKFHSIVQPLQKLPDTKSIAEDCYESISQEIFL